MLKDKNFTIGKVPDPNNYRKQSFCFSLTEYSSTNRVPVANTTLFLFSLTDEFTEEIIQLLENENVISDISFTGLKDNYITYELKLSRAVEVSDLW